MAGNAHDTSLDSPTRTNDLLAFIRNGLIGNDLCVIGPFGSKPVVYADYTASGRALSFIEAFIADVVLPAYANTHTESSGTGLQTTRFRDDARSIIARCVGATDEHAVLFCGSGTTACIDRIISAIGIRVPSELGDRFGVHVELPEDERPVVFIGPFEHHSNELPWRESLCDVETIPEDADGHIDVGVLREKLETYAHRPLLIGSFSAASNVTGIVSDTATISTLLHEFGALALWDYAAAAPYVDIDMGSPIDANGNETGAYFDAVFLSTHKFVGGPGTPGVLVVREDVMRNRVPVVVGGGTVAYVNPNEHVYISDIEAREEGGTPGIVESIRAGLVFQLREAVGVDTIAEREHELVANALQRFESSPNIEVLGNRRAERLSIVSFVVTSGGKYLHHNFVVALLNDVFGIQARGGCACAGPYGHRLLGIDLDTSHEYNDEISHGCEGIKPGWIRLNFNYFIDAATHDYICSAVEAIGDVGYKALPLYHFDTTTAMWWHRDIEPVAPLTLHDVSYATGEFQFEQRNDRFERQDFGELARNGRAMLEALDENAASNRPAVSDAFERLRWFRM